jgi:Cys-tRNA(Pro)/Cys-tRNA(Cys) deacylase
MTPAIDKAKKLKLAFNIHQYTHDDNAISYGQEAADKLGVEHHRVFKTLVVSNPDGAMAVAVIPVSSLLNLKLFAKALGWKKVAMADKVALTRATGYVLGGVSPLGQKKSLKTLIDSRAQQFTTIFVSAGKRGLEMELAAEDLVNAVQGKFANICGD